MKTRHGLCAARLAAAALTLLFAGGVAPAAHENGAAERIAAPDPAVVPSTPPTKKELEKRIKAADRAARDAARRARHFQRIADEAKRRGDVSKAEFNQKVADGFLREREDALARSAQARRMLADLKAGRTPQAAVPEPSSPGIPSFEDPALPGADNPGQPVPPGAGSPDAPFPGTPETHPKPPPVPDPPPAPPAGRGAALTIRGALAALQDPDNHPHTLCANLLRLPVVGRLLTDRRLELTLGDHPPVGCPLDCEGEGDEACTGECYGMPPIEGRIVQLRVSLLKSLVERPEVPALSRLPVVGKLFVRFPPETGPDLIFSIRPTVIELGESEP